VNYIATRINSDDRDVTVNCWTDRFVTDFLIPKDLEKGFGWSYCFNDGPSSREVETCTAKITTINSASGANSGGATLTYSLGPGG